MKVREKVQGFYIPGSESGQAQQSLQCYYLLLPKADLSHVNKMSVQRAAEGCRVMDLAGNF